MTITVCPFARPRRLRGTRRILDRCAHRALRRPAPPPGPTCRPASARRVGPPARPLVLRATPPRCPPSLSPQVLAGDRLMSSDYQLLLGADTRCNVLCDKTYDQEQLDVFTERINSEYTVSWVVDGLPAAVRMYEEGAPDRVHLERGALPRRRGSARERARPTARDGAGDSFVLPPSLPPSLSLSLSPPVPTPACRLPPRLPGRPAGQPDAPSLPFQPRPVHHRLPPGAR